jgi:hypothetical protein
MHIALSCLVTALGSHHHLQSLTYLYVVLRRIYEVELHVQDFQLWWGSSGRLAPERRDIDKEASYGAMRRH